MQKIINRALLLIIITLIGLLAYRTLRAPEPLKVQASTTVEMTSEAEFKTKVESVIKEYLSSNPEVVIGAIESFQKKKAQENLLKIEGVIKDKKAELEDAEKNPFLGNFDGNIPIIIFYDYNCGYCKKANVIIRELIQKNEQIKIVLRPLPILGDASVQTAKIALAVHKIAPSKFADFHNQLIEMQPITKAGIDDLIKASGILPKDIEGAMDSKEVADAIEANTKLAADIRIHGVPAFVIKDKLYPGALELKQIEGIIGQQPKSE